MLLSAAPFTAAIFLTALILPVTAFMAWMGMRLQSKISILLCILALVASPMSFVDLLELRLFVTWLCICLPLILAGFYAGSRDHSRPSA